MIVVKGLIVVVSHKQRALQNLQEGRIVNIGIRVVNKHAGFRVAVGVDVEVVSSAGNAAVHVFPVVLEVHGKEAFPMGKIADGPNAIFRRHPLFGGGQKFYRRVVSYGHVVEIQGVATAFVHHELNKVFIRDGLAVFRGVANGGAEDQAVFLQAVHSGHDFFIDPLTSAQVVDFRRAFQANGQH